MVMVVAALFASCTTETTDAPQMTEVGDIEVAFSVSGNEVSMLNLSPVSHRIVVDVTLNNEDIYWNVEANKEWCQILEEEHRGSGSFTMVIDANSVFDDREIAEVTFTAGEYAVRKLVVNHLRCGY